MRLLHLTITSSIAASLVLTNSGCALIKSSSTVPPPEPPPSRPEPTYVMDGPGCADARSKAKRSPRDKDIYPPMPRTVFVPVASDNALNGATLIMTVRVDSVGRAIPSSGRVRRHDNGVMIPGYASDITSALEKLDFRPAVLGGCAVAGTATLLYNTRR